MTDVDEIMAIKAAWNENELFQQSSSPFKQYQLEQFSANDEVLSGRHSRMETINGKEVLVIYNFNKDGLIHSEDNLPAIEYPMHWEYWENGMIKEVADKGGDTREYWENGVPVKIERNLSDEK